MSPFQRLFILHVPNYATIMSINLFRGSRRRPWATWERRIWFGLRWGDVQHLGPLQRDQTACSQRRARTQSHGERPGYEEQISEGRKRKERKIGRKVGRKEESRERGGRTTRRQEKKKGKTLGNEKKGRKKERRKKRKKEKWKKRKRNIECKKTWREKKKNDTKDLRTGSGKLKNF